MNYTKPLTPKLRRQIDESIERQMTEDCRDCPMCGYECDIGRTRCIAACRILAEHYKAIPFDGRPEWCPLEESEDLE